MVSEPSAQDNALRDTARAGAANALRSVTQPASPITDFGGMRRRRSSSGGDFDPRVGVSGGGGGGGVQSLYDTSTGEWIPGTGAGFGAELPGSSRPGWQGFNQSGNVTDERDQPTSSGKGVGRFRLGGRLGMAGPSVMRRGAENQLIREAALKGLQPNQLSVDAGMLDLIKAESPLTKYGQYEQMAELDKWETFDRSQIDPHTGLDRASISQQESLSSSGTLDVNVNAQKPIPYIPNSSDLLKPTHMPRAVAYQQTPSGPTVSDTASQYMARR